MSFINVSSVKGMNLGEVASLAFTEIGAGFVLLSTPTKFLVERYVDSGINAFSDIDSCFSARFFSPNGEVRWELVSESKGDCLVVTANAIKSASTAYSVEISGVVDHRYLCWGEVVATSLNGVLPKATIKSGRTSEMSLPIEAEIGDKIVLCTREYLAVSEESDGNTFVVDELLVGFSIEGEK
jgi:hypothetical protein